MKKYLIMIAAVIVATALFACKAQPPAENVAPAVEKARVASVPAVEPAKQEQAQAGTAPAEAGAAAATAKAGSPAAAEEPADEDPDDEGGGGVGAANLDKDKLAKCYEEVYCAQKKGEMEKLLDIYKKFGFEKPSDFTATWIEAAKDTVWITKIAHEVSAKCK